MEAYSKKIVLAAILSALMLTGVVGCDPHTEGNVEKDALTLLLQNENGSGLDLGSYDQEGYYASWAIWPNKSISVCWESAGFATEKIWVQSTIATTWQSSSALQFTGWGTCGSAGANIRINIADAGPHTKGLGKQLNNQAAGMVLNFTFNNWCTQCKPNREFNIKTIAIHEFGHAIGIAHEHNRADRDSDCTSNPQGTNGDTTVGSFDRQSIMNYCFGSSYRGQLSAGDIATVVQMYGSATPFASWAQTAGVKILKGDFNGDGRTDIALTGPAGWGSVPVAFSNGDGTFNVTNHGISNFGTWAATSGVKALTGDFNGDGRTDIALTGGAGWTSMPVAFSNGNGTFTVTNSSTGAFSAWSGTSGVRVLTGDYNGDGRTDVALTGGPGWASLPVAFSNGNGSFNVTNNGISNFAVWAAQPGVKVLSGDFNGDGRTDVALTGGPGWSSLPVAFSNGNGTFNVTNSGTGAFSAWSGTSGVRVLTGDYNGDGHTDVALTGGPGWASMPVAFSNGNGSFGITNTGISNFATWAQTPGVTVLSGDFNGNGRADVALTGGNGWASLPVAFSNANGSFGVTNSGTGAFSTWSGTSGVTVLTGDFNGDGRTDVALTGGPGWASLPVAFSNGNGSFTVTNSGIQ